MTEIAVPKKTRPLKLAAAGVIAVALLALLVVEIVTTQPIRDASHVYIQLLSAANHGDVATATKLCTDRYVKTHGVRMNPDGGMRGLPRIIHMNYQAWRDGDRVLICPTKYSGPVYGFRKQDRDWRFDGLAGYLRAGRVLPLDENQAIMP